MRIQMKKGKIIRLSMYITLIFVASYIWKIELDNENQVEKVSAVTGAEVSADTQPDVSTKKVALTFDDGPHPEYTPMLLDGLKERNVVATFFVIGEQAEAHPEIIQREYDEGHLVGNHTYSHVQLNILSDEQAGEEIQKTNDVIESIIGEPVEYVRPPYGLWKDSLDKQFEMICIQWDVDTDDWTTTDVDWIVNNALKNVEDGDIILMHDYYKSSVEAAFIIIDQLKAEGYQFVTVDKLIFD